MFNTFRVVQLFNLQHRIIVGATEHSRAGLRHDQAGGGTLLKIFYSAGLSTNLSPAQRQSTIENVTSSKELGFRPVLFGRPITRARNYVTLVSSWRIADIFLALYPHFFHYAHVTGNPLRSIDMRLIDLLSYRNRRTHSILFMMDLPIEQELAENKSSWVDRKSYEMEQKILGAFEIICVFNENARNTLSERYRMPRERFVIIGIHDYRVRPFHLRSRMARANKWTIVCAGSGERSYAGRWACELPRSDTVAYEFMGADWEWLNDIGRHDLIWKGLMAQQELVNYISDRGDFGIVAYSESLNKYIGTYTCPSKFATYVTSGTPIIVTSKCEYVSFLVRKLGLGFSLDSFDEIPHVLGHLSESEYRGMRMRCLSLARKMWTGYFFKHAVVEAMRRLHRY